MPEEWPTARLARWTNAGKNDKAMNHHTECTLALRVIDDLVTTAMIQGEGSCSFTKERRDELGIEINAAVKADFAARGFWWEVDVLRNGVPDTITIGW